ncbi:EAL domain-containing protein [Nitrogeniibacter mangrovi]|uniref:EAL domain-containing protein n=1 Tax=Nitrogeniibacter mangrovi TaxID=2016596 RepID=A0A6C1B4V3_9RHOO|nr:EAL domain-containing protein [Nitrogeniibacter mangrovi]QID18712.1 EAL domain-containing protein [Nitrogeniibacter mangrovi]
MPRDPDEPFVPDLSEGAEAGLYLSLFELMNEGLIITSDETILEVNSAVCRLMERSYRDLAGQPLSTLFPSERAFLNARAALFIQGEMRGSLRVRLGGGRERDLAYVAAARIRPGVHAIILSPDPVTGLGAEAPRPADTVWPRLAAALDQPALVINGQDRIVAANAPARRRFAASDDPLTGRPLAQICRLSDPDREHGPVTVYPADDSPALHGRLLTGPEPGWRILLLSGTAPVAPVDARSSRAFRHAPMPMLVVRAADGRIVAANDAAATVHGHARQSLLQMHLDALREDAPAGEPLRGGLWRLRGADGAFVAKTQVQPLDGGHDEWLVIHDAPSHPWPTHPAGIGRHLAGSAHAVLITDAEHRVVSANSAFEQLSGHAESTLLGEPLDAIATSRHDADLFDTMRTALSEQGHWQGELWLRSPSGEACPEWIAFNTVRDAGGRTIAHIGLFSDLSVRQQAEARAEYLANHDALTGLPNQRFIEARFDEALVSAQRQRQHLALVCMDIDGFRATNERFGANAGDLVLQQLAGRLRHSSTRAQIARTGSDQFCALLSGIDLISEVDREVEHIRDAFAQPFAIDGEAHGITACLGVAIFPGDGQDFASLWREAGNAMRNARLEGPGSCHFHTAELNAASLERMALESALASAVERDAVRVHFQPVTDASTGALLGAEALLRWAHPDLGLLKPSQFMSIAESSGLDCVIGFEVVRLACQHAAEWHQAHITVPVAINATANMLAHDHLVEQISAAITQSGLPADTVELNVPVQCLLAPADALTRHLFALDSLGVRIAVTGLGAQALPLQHMLDIPVHSVKLDRSLVRDCLQEGRARLTRATLAVADSLGLRTQAVGVESQAQAEALMALGCTRHQGHLYGAPLPPDEFAQLLS